jgi:hypothetical protein
VSRLRRAASQGVRHGEGFDYLGRHYRLQLTDEPPGTSVKLERGRLRMPRARTPADLRLWPPHLPGGQVLMPQVLLQVSGRRMPPCSR